MDTIEFTHKKILKKIQGGISLLEDMINSIKNHKTKYLTRKQILQDLQHHEKKISIDDLLDDQLLGITRKYSPYKIPKRHSKLCNKIVNIITNLNSLKTEYIQETSPIIDSSSDDTQTIYEQYYQVISDKNFSAKLNTEYNEINKILTKLSQLFLKNISQYRKKFKDLQTIQISISTKLINYEYCSNCMFKEKMIVQASISQLKCVNCGVVKMLFGTVFEDSQFYTQEGQKTKHADYDATRHYSFWMEKIQAKNPNPLSDEQNDKLLYCLKRDGYTDSLLKKLTCEKIREYLKETQMTEFNNFAPSILKDISGITPPQLTNNENKTMELHFNKVMGVYDKMVKGRVNRPYYPFFIYKLIEYLFKDNPEKLRLLLFIHIQRDPTLTSNDLKWSKICSELNTYESTPTDPNRYRYLYDLN